MTVPELYSYQRDAVEWVQSRDRAILALEQGLGKTAVSLSALSGISDRGMVVCPPGLKTNWEKECNLWRPDLKPLVLNGAGLAGFKWPDRGELVIVGYSCLPSKLEPPPYRCGFKKDDKSKKAKAARKELKARKAAYNAWMNEQEQWGKHTSLIADESHYVKNVKSKRSIRFKMLSMLVARTWFLTGTPMPRGNPLDLWGMLQSGQMEDAFRNWPAYLRQMNVWKNDFGGWEYGTPTPAAHQSLKKIMLRLKKEDVLDDIPDKTTVWQTVPIDKSIAEALSGFDRYMDLSLLELEAQPDFADYSRARRAIADSRISSMMEFCDQYEENETQLVVFSAHRGPIEALAKREGWEVILGGGKDDPVEICERLNRGEIKGVGATYGAAKEGLNMTGASHMLLVDCAWDRNDIDQAMARIHRIGQKNACTYTIFDSDHPVDTNVVRKIFAAGENIDIVIEGGDGDGNTY